MKQISASGICGSVFTLMFGIAFLFYGFRVSIHICYILLALSLAVYLFINRKGLTPLRDVALSRDIRLVLLAFGIYALASLPTMLLHQGYMGSWRMQEAFIKFLIYGFILYAVFKNHITLHEKLFYYILFIGGGISSLLAIYTRIAYGIDRVHLMNGIFQFGYFTGVIGIICLNVFLHYKEDKQIKILAGIVCLLCSFCLFLNVSRGIELGYIIAAVVSFFIYGRQYGLLNALMRFFAFVAIIAALFFSSEKFYAPLFDRLEEAKMNNQDFQKGEMSNIGFRYQMWDESIAMFKLSPILGMNAKMRNEMKEAIWENTHFKIPIDLNATYGFFESHNQILNALAKFGLIGLGALLFMYYAVFRVFIPKINTNARIYATSMVGIALIYVIDGFFNTPLDSKVEAPLFCLCVCVLLNLSAQKLQTA